MVHHENGYTIRQNKNHKVVSVCTQDKMAFYAFAKIFVFLIFRTKERAVISFVSSLVIPKNHDCFMLPLFFVELAY